MPDPDHTSGNIPRFDPYPAPAPEQVAPESSVEAPVPIHIKRSPVRELLPDTMAKEVHVNPALNETAQKIGTLLGTAVRIARSMPQQMHAVPGNVSSMSGRLREKSAELRADASEAAHELRHSAQVRMQQAREQARQFAYEKPIHVIVGIAGLAFCAGVALRIWRSKP